MLETSEESLRFGVMCAGSTFPAWQAQALNDLIALDSVELALLIVQEGEADKPPVTTKIERRLRRRDATWATYTRLAGRRSAATKPVDMSHALRSTPEIRCGVERQGRFSEYFDPIDIETIRGYDLDFILRFAFGVIRGEILQAARHGVWSFHHGDEERYRGGPPCFWEIYFQDPVTGSMLQRLTERLDGGVVLHKGFFRTVQHSYVRNRDAAYLGSSDWPARVCKDIQNGESSYLKALPSTSTAIVRHNPRGRHMVVFAARVARAFVSAQCRGILRSDQWNVGIVDAPIETFLNPDAHPEILWLPRLPKERYIADPFPAPRESGLDILVEEFDYRTATGSISAIHASDAGAFTTPTPIMKLGVHASYPYLFEYESEWFCVPEIADTHEIALFRALNFPGEWSRVATLVEHFDGLDSTVFTHGGLWWLLCTDRVRGPNTKLWGWYATDLLGPWVAHSANPLKTDVRSARPAGTPFVYQGALYRPAQDDSSTYGGAVTLNRVLSLSPTSFREEVAGTVYPDRRGPYPDGLHTVSTNRNVTVIDGKRTCFVWSGSRRELMARAKRLIHVIGAR